MLNKATGAVVAERLRLAHTHWTRLRGLLGTRSLPEGEGLWIKPCRQVHMFGMGYAIDLVFLDEGLRVVGVVNALAPNKISPKVSRAESVLELPVGSIARSGLGEETVLEIDGIDQERRGGRLEGIATALCNISLALLFALFATVHFTHARQTGQWLTTVPLVIQEGLLVALFLSRRRSIATSSRPFDWVVGGIGAFLPLFLRTTAQTGPLRLLGIPLQVTGLWVALMATVWLGRSFGLIAGNRGVKTGGVYRLARHPMYAAYFFGHIGYVMVYPSSRNIAIVITTIVALYVRAIVEERFLEADPDYRAYRERVPWRFIPLVH